VQRLFSGFADGWPGIGLLLLRLLTGLALIYFGIANLREAPPLATVVLQIIGIGAGILLLIGLWTPVAGALAAIIECRSLSRVISHTLAIHGFPSYRRSSPPFWPWSDLVPGPSMPGSSAGSASICQNSRGASFSPEALRSPPKVVASDLTILVTGYPTI
jgi:hypothetical protein